MSQFLNTSLPTTAAPPCPETPDEGQSMAAFTHNAPMLTHNKNCQLAEQEVKKDIEGEHRGKKEGEEEEEGEVIHLPAEAVIGSQRTNQKDFSNNLKPMSNNCLIN